MRLPFLFIPLLYSLIAASPLVADTGVENRFLPWERFHECWRGRYRIPGLVLPLGKTDLPAAVRNHLLAAARSINRCKALVVLEGHSERHENPAISLTASDWRSRFIQDRLVRHGVPASSITRYPLGETSQPDAKNPAAADNGTVVINLVFAKLDESRLVLATSSPGGSYYPVGNILANLWSRHLGNQDIQVTALLTSGTVDNIQRLHKGKAQLALAMEPPASIARKVGALENARVLATVWPDVAHFITADPTPEQPDLRELGNMKFICQPKPKSGDEFLTNEVFRTFADLFQNDQRSYCGGHYKTMDRLFRERGGGAALFSGLPARTVEGLLSRSADFQLLSVTDEQLTALNANGGMWQRFTIPAGTYSGQQSDLATAAVRNLLLVDVKVSERTVYLLTRALFENLPCLRLAHAALEKVDPERAATVTTIPFHPGAARYYREQGLLSGPEALNE